MSLNLTRRYTRYFLFVLKNKTNLHSLKLRTAYTFLFGDNIISSNFENEVNFLNGFEFIKNVILRQIIFV